MKNFDEIISSITGKLHEHRQFVIQHGEVKERVYAVYEGEWYLDP